ncbi:hypothetical protein BT69DRAFT_135251 [Atractiella rhizophila]|nr:hypothetical protein BT69DRAFT_135251 [Atractiella rhizophila]
MTILLDFLNLPLKSSSTDIIPPFSPSQPASSRTSPKGNINNLLSTLRSFWSATYEPSCSLASYIDSVRENAAELGFWGYPVSDDVIAMAVLSGLPKEWELFRNHIIPPAHPRHMLRQIDFKQVQSILVPDHRVLDVIRPLQIQMTNQLPLLPHSRDLPIPLELLVYIFELFLTSGYRMSTVAILSQVCRRWWNVSRGFQYGSVEFEGTDGYGAVLFNHALIENPIRCYLVKSLAFVDVYNGFFPFIYDILHGLPALESLDISWKRVNNIRSSNLVPPLPRADFQLPRTLKQLIFDGSTYTDSPAFSFNSRMPSSPFLHSILFCPDLIDLHVGCNILQFPSGTLVNSFVKFHLQKLRIERSPETPEPDRQSVILTHMRTLTTLFEPSSTTLRVLTFCYELRSLGTNELAEFIGMFKTSLVQLFLVIRDTGNRDYSNGWLEEGKGLPLMEKLEVLRVEAWTSHCTIDLLTICPLLPLYKNMEILCLGGQTALHSLPTQNSIFELKQLILIPSTISYEPAKALLESSRRSLIHLQIYDWDIFSSRLEDCVRFISFFQGRLSLNVKSPAHQDVVGQLLEDIDLPPSAVRVFTGYFPFAPLAVSPKTRFWAELRILTLVNTEFLQIPECLLSLLPCVPKMEAVDCMECRDASEEDQTWRELIERVKKKGLRLGHLNDREWDEAFERCVGEVVRAPLW